MDGQQFDALSRLFAATTNRRRTLRGLAVIALGGGATLATATGGDAANRTCRLAGQKCVKDNQCCSQDCDTARTTPRARRNRCTCGDLATCKGVCVDTQTDRNNCGGCGNVCDADWECTGGQCTCGGELTGASGEICCDNAWIDPDDDDDNCGECGNACGDGYVCNKSYCIRYCDYPTPNSGTCGTATACMIDENDNVLNLTNWNGLSIYGCGNPGGAACPGGSVCRIGWNPSYYPGMDVFKSYDNIGECTQVTTCTP